MDRISKKLLYFLYPSYCLVCQVLVVPETVLCDACVSCVKPVAVRRHRMTRHRTLVVHAVGAYRPPLDMLVRAKQRRFFYAAVVLGQLVARYLHQSSCRYDVIIPVPLHWSRRVWRGYNQAAVMAREVARYTNLTFAQPFRRRRYTVLQKILTKSQRRDNVAHAFGLSSGWQALDTQRLLAGKRVLLIDDVHTTGATLQSFAQFVWKFGPAQVHAVVGARVVD